MSKRRPQNLGQNFLTAPHYIEKIAGAALAFGLPIFEIGPGKGALTKQFVQQAKCIAVEYDIRLAEFLENLKIPNLNIIHQDILKVDPTALLAEEAVLAGNIPYYITSPILFWLIQWRSCFPAAVLMMQKEVGERILAKPGNKQYGLLSLKIPYYYQVKKEMIVKAKHFRPPPQVDSIVLSFVRKPQRPDLPDGFVQFINVIFQQRRKKILNPLKKIVTDIDFVHQDSRFSLRPEQLSFDELFHLYEQAKPFLRSSEALSKTT